MDNLERSYADDFEVVFQSIAEEMRGIRSALERIAAALQPKQESAPEPAKPSILSRPITALSVSARAESALTSNRCHTVEDVTKLTKYKLQITWHCGVKTIKEIETALEKHGLKLAA